MPVQSTYKRGCGLGFQGVLPPPPKKILDETLLAAVGGSSSSCIYLDADDDHSEVSLPEPSLHKLAQESSIAGWNKVRPDLLKAMIDSSAMPALNSVAYAQLRQPTGECPESN